MPAIKQPKSAKRWLCPICSYEHTGNSSPPVCPECEYEDGDWLEEVAS